MTTGFTRLSLDIEFFCGFMPKYSTNEGLIVMVTQSPSTPSTLSTLSGPQSFWDVLKLYEAFLKEKEPDKKATNTFNLLMTAITRYTLPGWGYTPPAGRKPTAAEKLAAEQALQILGVAKLKDALQAQKKVFELLNATDDQKYTYRSKLENFLIWAETQSWYPCDKPKQPTASHRTPKMRHGHRTAKQKRLTTRTRRSDYSCKELEMPEVLQLELKHFYQYLTEKQYSGRPEQAVKPGTAENYIPSLRRILGIIKSHLRPIRDRQGKIIGYKKDGSGVPMEDLSLNLIVPQSVVELKQPYELKQPDGVVLITQWEYESEEVAKFVDSLICCILNFLENERQCQSYKTLMQPIAAIGSVVRFHYHHKSADDSTYHNIPAMKVVRKHQNAVQKGSKDHKPVANQDMKWLDLPDVLKQIVNPLRDECEYRYTKGEIRSIKAIAYSFMLFIIWALLSYDPPRRQQEYRHMKIALSCPTTPRPASNQLIHPLPNDRYQGKEVYSGYLYKEDGIWYKHMTKESYKTGEAYGDQILPVPNPRFPNGKCFYDYLEAYLYGYYRDPKGNWQSGGELSDTPQYLGTWHSLRMALFESRTKSTPPIAVHNYVFVKPRTGGIYERDNFSRLVKDSAHRLSGKCITPHFLRDIYATWFLDGGYLEAGLTPEVSFPQIIAALAYAMGTSEKMLREVYDRRKPKDKRRDIDQLMAKIVEKSLE